MLLTADIGNTTISFGVFRRDKIIRRFRVPTRAYSFNALKRELHGTFIDYSIICSVVPKVSPILMRDLKKISYKKPYLIGNDIKIPIRNLYRKPRQVGQDRLVNAYAGIILYGAPLIVIDFGTAVTFDVISRNEEYLGGMILPGLRMALSALSERTALLPDIALAQPRELIGRDTAASMLSGVMFGTAALAEAFIIKVKKKIGANARVIATGGDAGLITRYCSLINTTDADLTLKGLSLILHNKGFVVPKESPWRELSKNSAHYTEGE